MTGEVVYEPVEHPKQVRSIHPQKFAMWLFIVSVIMIFISLSSAYVVKKGVGDWLYIDFPVMFQVSTAIIVASSITMHFAYISAKRNHITNIRIGLALTGVLAVGFVAGQLLAWDELIAGGFHFVGNPASSFIYVFTGLHVIHLAGALIFLFVVLIKAFKYKVHSKSMLNIEMCTTFWHFLGALWIYLYLFLILNN